MATTHLSASSLPSTNERPDAEVLIFDGHCRFCLSQVRKLCAMDTRGKLAFLSLHDSQVAERWPDLSHDELMRHIYLIDQRGCRYAGAAAFRRLSRMLPGLWWLMPLLHIPGSLPLWQFIYRRIARLRYAFGRVDDCESGSCDLHQS